MMCLSCSSGREWTKSPVDQLIRDLDKEKTFTIILYDMDVEGSFSKDYKHQYKIITDKNSQPVEEITGWKKVTEKFFFQNENNLGMELASKDSTGKVHKEVAPAGFSNYVGNPQYGQWVGSGTSSFWQFYGQYAFMSAMFNMFDRPRYGYYNDYYSNYRYKNRPYYGPKTNGKSYYGTYGKHTEKARPNFFKRKVDKIKQSKRSFTDRVKNRVRRSSSSSTRTSRSSSRYRSSSSFRSRGGGFGK